jgi:hypothetical protein
MIFPSWQHWKMFLVAFPIFVFVFVLSRLKSSWTYLEKGKQIKWTNKWLHHASKTIHFKQHTCTTRICFFFNWNWQKIYFYNFSARWITRLSINNLTRFVRTPLKSSWNHLNCHLAIVEVYRSLQIISICIVKTSNSRNVSGVWKRMELSLSSFNTVH